MTQASRIERTERLFELAQKRLAGYFARVIRDVKRMERAKKDCVRLEKLLRRLWESAVGTLEGPPLPKDPPEEGGK